VNVQCATSAAPAKHRLSCAVLVAPCCTACIQSAARMMRCAPLHRGANIAPTVKGDTNTPHCMPVPRPELASQADTVTVMQQRPSSCYQPAKTVCAPSHKCYRTPPIGNTAIQHDLCLRQSEVAERWAVSRQVRPPSWRRRWPFVIHAGHPVAI
jgi:hypothetical protein